MSNWNVGFNVMVHGVRDRTGHFYGVRTIYGDLNRLWHADVIGFGNFNGVRDGNRDSDVLGHWYLVRLGYLHLHVAIDGFHGYVTV